MFNAPKLTNAGKALYYDNMAGTQIVFTTIQLGSGNISGPIAPMTALVTPVVTINAEAKSVSGQYAEISGHFSNAQLADGFYFREIGVFAADPDYPNDRGKDILYCYQNAYDTADFIPVASVETVEKNITIPVIIGDAAAVSCTLSRSLILASMEDLDNHNKNQNAHEDLRKALEKKQEKITVSGLLKGDGKGGISAQQFDTKPTKDSGNLLTSGAVATAMAAAAALTSAAEYSAAMTYAVGAYCTKDGKLYRCTVAIPQAEAWNADHWTETTIGAELVAIYTTLANNDPRQWGLGTTNIHVESRDANNCMENGWYICNVNTPTGAWWYVFTAANYSNAVIVQKAWYYNSGKVIECMRLGWLDVSVDRGGGWQPWEYVNLPMALNTEYRTTERYLGKPVYCKVVDFGTAPNNDTKNVSLSGMNIDEVCDAIFHYYVPSSGENGVMTCHPYFTGLLVSNGVIQIRTNADRTNTNFYVTIKYTKITD